MLVPALATCAPPFHKRPANEIQQIGKYSHASLAGIIGICDTARCRSPFLARTLCAAHGQPRAWMRHVRLRRSAALGDLAPTSAAGGRLQRLLGLQISPAPLPNRKVCPAKGTNSAWPTVRISGANLKKSRWKREKASISALIFAIGGQGYSIWSLQDAPIPEGAAQHALSPLLKRLFLSRHRREERRNPRA